MTSTALAQPGAEAAPPMIEMADLGFGYVGRPPLFQGFSWRVEVGETWAIIGPSGCGKSTLLYLIAGLRHPTEGVLRVNGWPVPRPRASTGLILQDYGLLPWSTVAENVALVMHIGRFYRRKEDARDAPRPYPRSDITADQVNHWLARLGIDEVRDKYPGQISGGQRQRTAIARSLLQQPDLLLMDEPFSSLDALTREDLQDLTVSLHQSAAAPSGRAAATEVGLTAVVVTHSIEEAAFLGRRILVLGRPPNTAVRVVDNPAAGNVAYRGQPAFWRKCDELRALLTR